VVVRTEIVAVVVVVVVEVEVAASKKTMLTIEVVLTFVPEITMFAFDKGEVGTQAERNGYVR